MVASPLKRHGREIVGDVKLPAVIRGRSIEGGSSRYPKTPVLPVTADRPFSVTLAYTEQENWLPVMWYTN